MTFGEKRFVDKKTWREGGGKYGSRQQWLLETFETMWKVKR